VHRRKQRVLQRGEAGAGDDKRAQPGMHCDRHDDRPDQEPTGKDEGKRREHPGQRHARLEQIDGKKGATPAKCDGVDAVMQVEEINRPVAEEGHAACPDSIYVFRVFLMVPLRADNLMHGRTPAIHKRAGSQETVG
jgi:hypothetical protein